MSSSKDQLPKRRRGRSELTVYVLPKVVPAAVWHRLVRALVSGEQWFGLVWRDDESWSKRARGVREFLSGLLLDERRAERWPGTQLFGHQATVSRYHTSPAVLPLLLATDGPYSWISPDLPEDLFFGSNAQLAFASVAHERHAWLLRRRYARLVGQDVTLSRQQLDARDSRLLDGVLA
jgi:hypothetical protein